MSFTEQKFHLNFNLDVLYGCQFSCDGCHVDKTGQNNFVDGDVDRFIKLTKDFIQKSYIPSLLVVGPTDIFAAGNTKDILLNPKFQELASMYIRLTFNTTFIKIDNEIIEILNKYYSNNEIEFKVVVEAMRVNNDAYLTNISQHKKETEELLNCKQMTIHPQFNLFNYKGTKMEQALSAYETLNERSYDYFDQGIDYVLSFSRTDHVDHSEKLEMLEWIKEMFNEHVRSDNTTSIHFDAGNLTDFEEHIFTYKSGEFYFSPKVYDEYVGFEDYFKMNIVEWTAQEFEDYETNLTISQYSTISNKPCSDCRYAPVCVDRGMPFFMDYLGIDHCIVPRDAYDAINTGALQLNL